MHIDKVMYQKTFNLGSYCSHKIGVEVSIDEGEDAKEALNIAKSLVEEYHKESYVVIAHEELLPEVQKKNCVESTVNYLIQDIESCKEIKVLESYKIIAKSKPELQKAYDKILLVLTNK